MAQVDDVVQTQPQCHQPDQDEEDEITMKFLDSLDDYMRLIDSLSSSLGQGLFQLASARYSMGASRINSALLNLKPHDAVTRLQMTCGQDQPQFTLLKWVPSEDGNSGEIGDEDEIIHSRQEDNDTSPCPEPQKKSLPAIDAERQVQRERLKSLAVFGALVPPRLRDSQQSFEKALETLVEIANARSSMLSAFGHIKKDIKRSQESSKEGESM